MGEEQTKIAVLALSRGGNIRVGTEDFPFIETGVPAKNNAEIIGKFVNISRYIGRDIADPSEARKIIGL
jgi:3-keto-5-aminohexanoate cleavage enzyme